MRTVSTRSAHGQHTASTPHACARRPWILPRTRPRTLPRCAPRAARPGWRLARPAPTTRAPVPPRHAHAPAPGVLAWHSALLSSLLMLEPIFANLQGQDGCGDRVRPDAILSLSMVSPTRCLAKVRGGTRPVPIVRAKGPVPRATDLLLPPAAQPCCRGVEGRIRCRKPAAERPARGRALRRPFMARETLSRQRNPNNPVGAYLGTPG